MQIHKDLRDFFTNLIRDFQPKVIIPIDRKGMALIRTLLDERGIYDELGVDWSQILCDSALDLVDDNFFDNKRILIFDDSAYHGHTIKDVYRKILDKGIHPNNLIRAVFSSHELCNEQEILDRYYYSQLSEITYAKLQENLVDYLQRRGALLLDTEHLEVPIRLNCARRDFFSALSNGGDTVEFTSYGSRISMTIHNPVLIEEEKFKDLLPDNTLYNNVVCKCRLVQRADNMYALIPLYYPSIPVDGNDQWRASWPSFIGNVPHHSPDQDFQVAGILGALQVIKSIMNHLKPLLSSGQIFTDVPDVGTQEDTLSHLRSILPSLSIPELRIELLTKIAEGKTLKLRKSEIPKRRKHRYIEGRHFQFDDIICPLLVRILELSELCPEPRGASFSEVLSCSGLIDIPEVVASAGLDRAIDDGCVIAKQSQVTYENDIRRIIRVFRPEGEHVSTHIRRLMTTKPFMC